MTANISNEKLKRGYFRWLREAKGFSESTVVAIERALSRWEEFSNFEDFGRFTSNKAIAFKKHLENPAGREKPLSANSRYHCLAHVRMFFQWLSTQSGYKSRITAGAITYLTLDRKTVQSISSLGPRKCPTLEYVRRLVDSIEIRTEIDQRDQALIAFLFLSGMRDKAISTLPLGCFDSESLEVRQDPQQGVATKFGKSFSSHLVKFDGRLLEIVEAWVKHLREVKLFCDTDPLFPRSKVAQVDGGLTFESREVEPVFWRGTGSIRQILKTRSEAAGLAYYYPHSFRHAHVHLAMKHCHTAEQMKAVSQNLGHEHVGTTLGSYGTLDQYRVGEIIGEIDFDDTTGAEMSSEEVKAVEKALKILKNRT
jgi:integrase/recombinase XerD